MSMKFLKTIAPAALSELWEKVSGNIVPKDTSANVGIGTDDPGRKLEVSGEESIIRVSDSDSTGTATVSYMEFGSDTGTWDRHSYIGTASGANSDFYIANEETGDILFYTSDTFRQVISSGGNVGIGTDAPATILELESGSPVLQYDGTDGSRVWKTGLTSGGEFVIRDETASLTRMTFNTDGSITAPYQPAFQAKLSSDQANLGTGSNVTILFASDSATGMFDQGGDFNTGTYTFTAPVDGKYQFNVFLRLDAVDADASNYQIQLITSDYTYNNVIVPTVWDSDGYWTFAFSVLADMDANDTAYVVIFQLSGTAQTDVVAASTFSGVLIC